MISNPSADPGNCGESDPQRDIIMQKWSGNHGNAYTREQRFSDTSEKEVSLH